MAHGPWPGLPPASPLPRTVTALAHFSRLSEANDICHGRDPLPQRSTESVLKEHSGIGSNPCSYFYKYVCVQQGQRDSVLVILNPMTFSWGESLGQQDLLLFPGLCHGSTSLDIPYTLSMMLCGTSSGTSFRARRLVWKAIMCWCEWLALGQARYSGQTHHTAAVRILAGPGFAAERFTPVNWPLLKPANHMSD